jgi:hypothetical protein
MLHTRRSLHFLTGSTSRYSISNSTFVSFNLVCRTRMSRMLIRLPGDLRFTIETVTLNHIVTLSSEAFSSRTGARMLSHRLSVQSHRSHCICPVGLRCDGSDFCDSNFEELVMPRKRIDAGLVFALTNSRLKADELLMPI